MMNVSRAQPPDDTHAYVTGREANAWLRLSPRVPCTEDLTDGCKMVPTWTRRLTQEHVGSADVFRIPVRRGKRGQDRCLIGRQSRTLDNVRTPYPRSSNTPPSRPSFL